MGAGKGKGFKKRANQPNPPCRISQSPEPVLVEVSTEDGPDVSGEPRREDSCQGNTFLMLLGKWKKHCYSAGCSSISLNT